MKQHQRNSKPLQLINPSASAYVSLTPALASPLEPNAFTSTTHLSTSQHTLKTLAGGRYYDEYDEDEPSIDPVPVSPNHQQPTQASFPPPTHHPQPIHQAQFVHLTPNHTKPSSSIHPSSFTNTPPPSSDRPPITPSLALHWQNLAEQRPLLAFSIRLAVVLFSSALLLAGLVWCLLPPFDPKDLATLRIPTSFDALKKLNALLQIYKTENYYRVLSSFVLIYLFLQAFSLPGSMYLSILAGAMFGVQVALPLVCLCVGTGAMLCYLMSLNLASTLVLHSPCLRTRLNEWKIKLSTKTNKLDLFSYLVVIRISPLPPHWVVNLLAPHVGIPLGLFWFTTCLGILPVSLIHTQLGTTLDQMVGPEDLSFLTTKNLTGLGLVAVGVMVPVVIRWYLKKDLDDLPTHHSSSTSTRAIGLSLEDEPDLTPRRPNRLRSLSAQTFENLTANSSFSSLNKLARIDSSETLLLSSHLKSPPTVRPSHLPYPRPLRHSSQAIVNNDKASHAHHHHQSIRREVRTRIHPDLDRELGGLGEDDVLEEEDDGLIEEIKWKKSLNRSH